jgi:CheY-like chemotaxis protein
MSVQRAQSAPCCPSVLVVPQCVRVNTTITITLGEQNVNTAVESQLNNALPFNPLVGKVVLIVDDDDFVRTIMSDCLAKQGAIVFPTSSVQEARGVLSEKSIDMIVCDEEMPRMRGSAWYTELRTEREIPFLLVTGRSDLIPALIEKHGFAAIAKPFRLEVLTSEVSRLASPGR